MGSGTGWGGGRDPMELNSRTRGGGSVPRSNDGSSSAPTCSARLLRCVLPRAPEGPHADPERFLRRSESVDAIVSPTTPTPAFRIGRRRRIRCRCISATSSRSPATSGATAASAFRAGLRKPVRKSHVCRSDSRLEAVRRGNALPHRPRLRAEHRLAPGTCAAGLLRRPTEFLILQAAGGSRGRHGSRN